VADLLLDEVQYTAHVQALFEIKGRIKQALSRCGNEIVQPENADLHVADILYAMLNRAASETQSLPQLSGGLL
jgi:hypothetical protein